MGLLASPIFFAATHPGCSSGEVDCHLSDLDDFKATQDANLFAEKIVSCLNLNQPLSRNNDVTESPFQGKTQYNPELWTRNIKKTLNNTGLKTELTDSIGRNISAKHPAFIDCTTCTFKCSEKINEFDRMKLNREYWSLKDKISQRNFILANVDVRGVERTRVDAEKRKKIRSISKFYYFFIKGVHHRVCQKFFISTLRITNGSIEKAVFNST